MRPGDCQDARIVRPGGVPVLHRTEGGTDRPPATGWAVARGPSLCLVAQRAWGTGRCVHPLCLVGVQRRCCSHPSSPLTAHTEAGISLCSLTGTWCWPVHWPVVASRCATHVEGLTAGLARAMTPHPRDEPLGGGESAWRSTAAKGGDGATAGNAPWHCCAEGGATQCDHTSGEGGARAAACCEGWVVSAIAAALNDSVKPKKTQKKHRPGSSCHRAPL
jgi:hypothetical protein